jgi:hypothetical protein
MMAKMPVECWRPWNESEAQVVIDHGESAGGQGEALAVSIGDGSLRS